MSTYRPQQPFKGMTLAQMKKKWQSMTPKERSMNVQTFRDAAKKAPAASKPKPAPAKPKPAPAKSKPASAKSKPTPTKPKPIPTNTRSVRQPGSTGGRGKGGKVNMPYAGSTPGSPKRETLKPRVKRNRRGRAI